MGNNPVVFWELASHDAAASVEFLRKAFDWTVEFNERVGFHIVDEAHGADKFNGGVFTLRKAKLPFLTIYIQVDDIDAKAKLIEELGGHIVEGPVEVGDSRICLFNEPSGVTLAMLQAKPNK